MVHKPSAWAVFLALVSVSFAAPLFRTATLEPLAASALRLLVATLILAPFAWKHRGLWATWSRRRWVWMAVSAFALAAHFGLWVTSLHLTTIAASTSLVTLQGILTAIGGSLFLQERLQPRNWLGVVIASVGAWVLAGGDLSGSQALGNALALAGGVGSAAYILIGRRARRDAPTLAYAVPVYALAGLFLLVAAIVAGQPLLPASWGGGTSVLLLAIVPMIGGHTLINYAMGHIRPATVMTWILLEPVGSSLLAWWWFTEIPARTTIGGGLVILVGAILVVAPQGRRVTT